jgi:2-dehydropantoate 2-reductase
VDQSAVRQGEDGVKVAVMGAGAVGCYFGARLQQAGHSVVLIGRRPLVDAVCAQGLHLTMRGFDGFLPLEAAESPETVRGAELVLFCVKSGDTESAGAALLPYLDAECTVLSLQNGVDNPERLAVALGREVIPVVVYVAVEMAGPGHVLHHGRGELLMGPGTHTESVARALNEAGIPATVAPRVMDALWAKLTINCAYNALSALTQLPYKPLMERPGIRECMRDVFEECRAVAAASGITLPHALWDDVLAISDSMAGQRSSTAQDVARGRRSEIDFINGYIVRRGAQLGIATPVNRCLHSLVRVKDDLLSLQPH